VLYYSNSAVSTANTATATANSASSAALCGNNGKHRHRTNASAAVTTANTASTNATAAVNTANSAATDAATAISTANGAVSTANAATATANTASATATTASTNASAAVTTANTATTTAGNAVTTANNAVTTANSAVTTAGNAVTTANNAVTTANSAVTTANSAVTTANAAASAVANAILYDTVANVAAIPATPANNDAVEVVNSTGIQSFTPLNGIPGGFVGSSGLSVRIVFTTASNTWSWIQYFPNDPESRYLKLSGGTVTGALVVPLASASTPSLTFTGDLNTGIFSPGADQVAIATNGSAQFVVNSSGQATLNILGSAATPAYSWIGDPNTGIYRPGADELAISTGGVERITITSTGDVVLDNQADLRFREATANGTNYVGFQAPASLLADVLWTLPAADGTAGQVISTNGTGILSWVNDAVGATGAGLDKIFFQNDQTVTTSYTIPSGKNALSTGPIGISVGIDVTVSANSTWVIL
jgi:hypothetical protein